MTHEQSTLKETAQDLRREFDLSFAQARRSEAPALEKLLALRVGGDAYAVRLDEIAGLLVDRHIVPVPTPRPEFLGLSGFRGQVVPVYDLAALLGYLRPTASRWLVLVRGPHLLGLAFEALQMHLVATSDQIVLLPDAAPQAPRGGGVGSSFMRDAVRTDAVVRPIIRLASVVEEVQRSVDAARHARER